MKYWNTAKIILRITDQLVVTPTQQIKKTSSPDFIVLRSMWSEGGVYPLTKMLVYEHIRYEFNINPMIEKSFG